MTKLRFQLLGPLQLHTPTGQFYLPRRQPLAILAYLAVVARPVPRDTLALLLCSTCDQATARARIRRMLHELRAALRAHELGDIIRLEGDAATLDLTGCDVDVLAFVRMVAANDPAALDLYRGPLLDGFQLNNAPEFEIWMSEARERFALLHLSLLERLANEAAVRSDWTLAADYAQRLVAADPLNEEAHGRLIEAHAARGNTGGALRQYEQLRGLLRRELDVEPLPETTARLQRLIHGRVAQLPQPTVRLPDEPLVGRARELMMLHEGYQLARTAGIHIVCVEGTSGVGKTRLVEEGLARIARLTGNGSTTVLRVLCNEHLSAAPYGALAETLRAHLLPNDHPFLRPPRTEGNAEIQFWEQLLIAMRRTATTRPESQSAQACLVLVIDDIQSADSALLRALPYLLRRLMISERGSPACLVLITARNEEQPPAVADLLRSLARSGVTTWLPLKALGPSEVDDFVRAYVGSEIGTLGDRLFHETEGNPFILVEMLRELRHSGALERPGAGEVALPLPRNVRAALEERLLRLPPQVQQLAEAAAVLGREVDLELLQRIGSVRAEMLVEQLERLEHAGLMVAKNGVYQFDHGKTQAIIYERLSEARRRLLHRRVAQALDRAGHPRFAAIALTHAQLAHEWQLAFRAARRAASEARRITARADALVFERAALHALDALGDTHTGRATVLFAYENDAHLLGERAAQTEALDQLASCALDAEHQTLLLYRRARNHDARARHAEAQVLLEQALDTHPASQLCFLVQLELAHCLSQQGAYTRAQQTALQVLAEAQETKTVARQLQAYLALAQIAQAQDDTNYALSWLAHAQPLAATQPDLKADILAMVARTHARRGDYEQMLRHALDAHTIAQAHGNVRLEADCLRLQGVAAGRLYRFSEAEDAYSRARSLYTALDDPQGRAAAILNLAIVRYRIGDFVTAHEAAAEAYAIAAAIPDRRGQAITAINLSTISLMGGNGSVAETWARTAAALADELDLPLVRAIASTNLAGALVQQGRFAEACATFLHTLSLRPPGDIGRVADFAWLAFTCLQLGDLEAAEQHSATAIHDLAACSGIDIPQQVHAVRALLLHARGDAPGAARAIHIAQQIINEQLARMPSAADRQHYLANLATNRFVRAAQHGDWTSEHPLF